MELLLGGDPALFRFAGGRCRPQGVGVRAEVGLVAQRSDAVVLPGIVDPVFGHREMRLRRVNHQPGPAHLEGDLFLFADELDTARLVLALRHGQTHPRLRREDRLLRGEQGLVVVDGIRVVEAVNGKVLGREAALVELGHEGVGGVVGPQGALLEIDLWQKVAPGRPHVVPLAARELPAARISLLCSRA